MQTVLITGGTGFLGSKIVELFLADGCRVVVLARETSSFEKLKKLENHPALRKVLIDKDYLDKCFSQYKIDAIIHTATCYGRNNETLSEIEEVNLLLPTRLLSAGEHVGVKCFINADTFFNDKMGFTSNESLYVKTKKDFLEFAKNTRGKLKIKFFNLRIEHMYGPNDNSKKFIPFIIKELLANVKNIPLTNGDQKRDFVFVDDVASAFLNSFKNHIYLNDYEEFGVGNGVSVSIKEVVDYIKKITDSGSVLDYGKLDYRKNEIMDSYADLTNNKKINWHAKIEWRDGIKKTVEFYRNLHN